MTKKLLFLFFLCFAEVSLAQNTMGKFSIKPMAGANVTTFGQSDFDGIYHSKVRLNAGFETEYGLAEQLGLSLGLFYSQQGADIDGGVQMTATYESGVVNILDIYMKGKQHTDYLNVPLMAHFYIPVLKGLCIKTGFQLGVLVNDRVSTNTLVNRIPVYQPSGDVIVFYPNGLPAELTPASYSYESDLSDVIKPIDFGIPVGLSYEYKRVCLDARYYFGLKKVDKTDNPDKIRNRYLSITLGYRFDL